MKFVLLWHKKTNKLEYQRQRTTRKKSTKSTNYQVMWQFTLGHSSWKNENLREHKVNICINSCSNFKSQCRKAGNNADLL